MKAGTWLKLFVAVCLLGSVTACGADSSSDPGNGSKTNWLSSCESDSDCGSLECVDRVCTTRCSESSECTRFSDVATCTTGSTSTIRACLVECSGTVDCKDDDLECIDERCVADVPAPCTGGDCSDAGPSDPGPGPEPSTPATNDPGPGDPAPGPDVPGAYEPCAGKLCGDTCAPCAANDPDCVASAEVHYCDPEGDCHGSLSACPAEDCAERDPTQCGEYGCTPLSARPSPQDPAQAPTSVACGAGELECDAAITCALDSAGDCWRFNSGCIPADFSALGCGDARCCEGDECTGQYAPCAGKACGDSCQLCAPGDAECGETAVEKFCNAAGVCEALPPLCPMPIACTRHADCTEDEYCYKTSCDADGECRPDDEAACDAVLAPVCGCDGMTYSNDCEAATAGVGVRSDGECTPSDGCVLDTDCGDNQLCYRSSCDAPGQCGEYNSCTAEYDPICGCSGTTYGNSCSAGSIDYVGECFDALDRGAMWRSATVSFGFCAGQCRFTMTRNSAAPSQVLFESCDNAGMCEAAVTLELNEAGLRKLGDAQTQLRMTTLEDIYGCPDCADGGATAFSVEGDKGVTEHSYEYSNAPAELSELDAFVMDMYLGVVECNDGAYYAIEGDCTPRE